MKTLFAAVLLAGTLAGFGAAEAAQGCGPGFHADLTADAGPMAAR